MKSIGARFGGAAAVAVLACAPLPAVEAGFDTQWTTARGPCATYSTYCNLALQSAWNERVLPIAAECRRGLVHPEASKLRLVVTLGADGEILEVAESPPTQVGACLAERVGTVELPAPPVANFRFRVPFETNP